MNVIKIVSDGTALGTQVFSGEKRLDNVVLVKIDPIISGTLVSATVVFCAVELDLVANATLEPVTPKQIGFEG